MNREVHKESDVMDEPLPEGVVLKEHTYDGIREYDQRLPRWWLMTLYGAMVFAAVYWLLSHPFSDKPEHADIDAKLAWVETLRLQNSIDVTNNAMFWTMSENETFVSAGREIYMANCLACHGADLKGGIGFNLVDEEWVHGASPASIYRTVQYGVPEKGMQAWESLLGQKRIAEVVAFILSQNDRATLENAALVNP